MIFILVLAVPLLPQEKQPRYTYHTEIRPDGTVYHYAIDHSPEAQRKVDAQFGPSQKTDTKSLGY